MLPILPKNISKTQAFKNEKQAFRNKVSKLILFIGLILIATQLIPLGYSTLYGKVFTNNKETFLPISESFLQSITSIQYIDAGEDYFGAILSEYKPRKIDSNYHKLMKITVAGTEIENIKLTPNIAGGNSERYNTVLKTGVAHLKGTSVPGDPGTSVIYGHSGIAGFLAKKNSPQIIFSHLDTVSIGDTMSIIKEGQELRYIVSGKKIIASDNLTFLNETDAKERAVLLTCWPLGIGTKRLIIIADRI